MGSCYLRGIVPGDGNAEMGEWRTYLGEISGSCCRADGWAVTQGGSWRWNEVTCSAGAETPRSFSKQSAKQTGRTRMGRLRIICSPSFYPFLFMHKILSPLQVLTWFSIIQFSRYKAVSREHHMLCSLRSVPSKGPPARGRVNTPTNHFKTICVNHVFQPRV